jgi:membrane fusion protein, multidrug efflux system
MTYRTKEFRRMAKSGSGRSWSLYLVGLLVLAGAGWEVWSIWQQRGDQLLVTGKALAAAEARGPTVRVVTVKQGPTERLITLLGDARPNVTATIYGKIGGYLAKITVDRGDVVKVGDVLAVIESRETDNQYASSIADLENKKRLSERARDLYAHGNTSQQAYDQAETDLRVSTSRVAELATMKSYEILQAPFDGTITARFIDPGALVQNAGANMTSSQPVLTIADTAKLRIDIHVEQRDVPFVHVGDVADVSDAAHSDRSVKAKIARTSGQLDPRTRTLFVELEVDNANGFLVPGSFAYVTLHVPIESYPEVPAAALITRGANTFVAGVGDDKVVHILPVRLARSDGMQVGLKDGVKSGQRVALNVPDEIVDGSKVQPVEAGR